VKVAAISDLHGHLPEIPKCDVLLIAGDVCPVYNHEISFQSQWLRKEFRPWLDRVEARYVIGVAGNHDFVFQAHLQVPPFLRWEYLQDNGVTFEGVNFWGSPWQPIFGDWAFNLDDSGREARWSLIPDDTHVLVLHGPPYGYGDKVALRKLQRERGMDPHVGCRHLRDRIERLPQLRLAVFGHIHPGHGIYHMGSKVLANVAILDDDYRPAHPVSVFEV
jgi:Icc-related predicted phosphoesterase